MTRVKLPDDVGQEEPEDDENDLIGELVVSMNDLLKEKDVHVVKIAEDTKEEGDQNEQPNEEEKLLEEADSRQVAAVEDDSPKEDFFDVKDDEEAKQTFGEIEGMEERTLEDGEEVEIDDEHHSMVAKRLSQSAEKFVEGLEEIKISSSPVKIETETGNAEEVEQTEAQTEELTEEQTEEELKEQTEGQAEEASRVAKIMIVDPTIGASSPLPTAVKNADSDELSTRPETIRKSIRPSTSLTARRSSIREAAFKRAYYDVGPKPQDSDSDIMQFFDLGAQDKFILMDDVDQEGEEEEIFEALEEEAPALNRIPYYLKYETMLEEIAIKRIRNNILNKKVTMYLKRRKVDNFLREGEQALDQLNKYNHKLDAYEQVLEVTSVQRKAINEELGALREKKMNQSVKLDKLFKAMQTREANIGNGLIFMKTANPIPEKMVERLIKRQKTQMEQVSTMRLKYIKLKGMVQEKLDGIEKIDILENNLRLADYEQLKVDNRNHADKMEEREEELTRLRSKCQSTIQVLAHMREKSAALETDVSDLRDDLEYAESLATDHRTHLSEIKHQKDKYRHLISKIKTESGLLIETDLLRDMEASKEEILKITEALDVCQSEVVSRTNQIRNLRKNIEICTEAVNKKKAQKIRSAFTSKLSMTPSQLYKSIESSDKVDTKTALYRRRPTMYMPKIQSTALDDLVQIKPNPKTPTRKRR